MPPPSNVPEVRRFLGLVNQQSKYIPQLAEKTEPLHGLLKKNNHWVWGEQQTKSFETVRNALAQAQVLALYEVGRETVVSADASSFGLEAVLRQRQPNGDLKIVAYASRSLSEAENRYAQIEKEALAVTWAAEKFSRFLIGMKFTDHKPLVPLLSYKGLDEIPPRIQRFRMRLFRFLYDMSHVSGKQADVLFRQPLSSQEPSDEIRECEVEKYTSTFMQCLPVSETRLRKIIQLQDEDAVCSRVKQFVSSESWPATVKGEFQAYRNIRNELHVQDGLLLRGTRIVIPPTMRAEVLDAVHISHQGITKCRERARQAVWWPNISTQIESLVSNCPICCRERRNPAEPMISTPFPAYPWQRVGTDIFEWKGRQYLLVIDYYSRYIENTLLSSTTSAAIVNHLKSIFARQGIPEKLMSDNGPQYASETFATFAKEYQFRHVTSSPDHAQANGEAERAVGTLKMSLKKQDDPYLALLSYRSTPLRNGFSPAELLMSRKLRTTIPIIPAELKPKVPDLASLAEREEGNNETIKESFDTRHQARLLSQLPAGTRVWIPDQKQFGSVISPASPRSYIVETPTRKVRHNRRSLNLAHNRMPRRISRVSTAFLAILTLRDRNENAARSLRVDGE